MTTSSDRRTLRPRQIFIKTLHRFVPDEAAVMLVIAGAVGIVGHVTALGRLLAAVNPNAFPGPPRHSR